MPVIDRRTFTSRFAFGLSVVLCPICARAAKPSEGCRLRKAGSGDEALPKLVASSGQRDLDELVATEAKRLNELFEVRPTVGFFDDSGAPNALALPEPFDRKQPDGTVLIGVELARTISQAATLNSLIGVMAHEWGHILQFKAGYDDEWGVRHELTADYLAGWYLYRTQGSNKELKNAISNFLFGLGDTDFANPDYHGSPKQRSRILLLGAGEVWHEGEGRLSVPPRTASEAFEEAQSRIR